MSLALDSRECWMKWPTFESGQAFDALDTLRVGTLMNSYCTVKLTRYLESLKVHFTAVSIIGKY